LRREIQIECQERGSSGKSFFEPIRASLGDANLDALAISPPGLAPAGT
jgi:hypothetical protein